MTTSSKSSHPLHHFNNKRVQQLVANYFEQNCVLAGVPSGLGQELIDFVWQQKNKTDFETLRLQSLEKMQPILSSMTTKPTEKNSLYLLDFSQAKTLIDIGANKLAAINFFGNKFPAIEQLIAVDIIPQRRTFHFPTRSKYIQTKPDQKQLPLPNASADVVQFKFVLHHLQSKEHIKEMLSEAHRLLKTGGRLIIWEETFTDNFTQHDLNLATQAGIQTDWEMTQQFYQLSNQQRKNFIAVLDWVINVANPHMPWTGQYCSWNEWLSSIKPLGFQLQRKINLGLRLSGKPKQGVHVLGEFVKS
jgi:hypothetical protein